MVHCIEHHADPYRAAGVNGLLHAVACINDIHALVGGTVVHTVTSGTAEHADCFLCCC